ncbi:MAG TPA: Uma2 family endonuclease [Planctomycetota bacterium]|nr:Uma2 family endonuclease [Planctomycetota bacterium]
MSIMFGRTVTTAEQLLSMYEPGRPTELVRGVLRRLSPAGYRHGAVIGRLAGRIGPYARERNLGETFGAETGFILARNPDTVRAPDVAFVQQNRLPSEFSSGYFPGPPDLAVEVTSPTDTYTEVHQKALSWLEHGTRLVWVIDPVARHATVYRGRDDMTVLGADEELTGGDVLPGFTVALRDLFPAGS